MPDIRYTFSAQGQNAVKAAFHSIEEASVRTRRAVGRSMRAQSGPRAASQAKKAAQARTDAELKSIRDVERAQRQAQRRAARHHLRLLEQQQRERIAAEKRVAREQRRLQRRAQRDAERDVKRQQRAAAGRRAGRGRMIRQIAGRALGGAIRGVGAAGLATAGVVGLAARQGIALQDRATRLAIKGTTIGQRVDPTVLRREAESIARNVRGATAGGVIAAQERFVGKTGRLDLARQFGEEFAKISVATGTEMDAIGSAAADMFEKFDIKTVDDMGKALALLAVQGKRGAFEMEDAASQFPKIGAAAQRFGLSGVKGLATLGGLSQIARRATPSGEEAATSVESMFKQLIMKSDVIERRRGVRGGLGVKVFEDKGKTKTRDVRDILVETIGAAKGNLPALQKIFDIRGIRAVSPLISLFNKVRLGQLAGIKGKATPQQEAAATAAGMQALRDEIDRATNVSAARAEIEEDLSIAQQQSSANITAAWESLVAAVNSEFTPALIEAGTGLTRFIEQTDFSGVVRGFTALAEAAGIAVSGLEALGVITKKKKSPEQVIKEGQREIAKTQVEEEQLLRKIGGARGLRKADNLMAFMAINERRRAAETKISKARESVFQGDIGDITQPQFVERLTAQGVNETIANRIASSIAADPTTAEMTGRGLFAAQRVGVSGFLGRRLLGGETEEQQREQQRLIAQFAQSQTAARTLGQTGPIGKPVSEGGGQVVEVNTEEANLRLGAFASALDAATGALFSKASALAEAL